jgi:lysophospholipase L1-like esterase
MHILKLLVTFLSLLIILQGCKSASTTSDDEEKHQERTNKKIFIIGDSTVHNTRWEDDIWVSMGWGDKLQDYLINPKNLYNLAEPGASSKSYKYRNYELEYDGWFHNWHQTKEIIENSDIREGGYLLIQFGHNDKTYTNVETTLHTLPGPFNSFYNELKEYISYAKKRGLTPILITPVEKMYKTEGLPLYKGHITEFGDYAQTIRDLSENENVLLLDLQEKSWSEFNNYKDSYHLTQTFGYKNDDLIHFSPQGADLIAKMIVQLSCQPQEGKLCLEFN